MSMMQKKPRPLSASLLAPKGGARPAQTLDHDIESAVESALNSASYTEQPAAQTGTGFMGPQAEGRPLFDVPTAAKPAPKFGKKQSATPPVQTTQPDLSHNFESQEPVAVEPEAPAPAVVEEGSYIRPRTLKTTSAKRKERLRAAKQRLANDAETMAGASTSKKAAFTFRMCEKRHFRLRLLSAHQNRSSQKILEAALDDYLETHAPQTAGMACQCFDEAQPS